MNEQNESGLIHDVRELEASAFSMMPGDQRDKTDQADTDGTDAGDTDGTDGDSDGTDTGDSDGTDNA